MIERSGDPWWSIAAVMAPVESIIVMKNNNTKESNNNTKESNNINVKTMKIKQGQ